LADQYAARLARLDPGRPESVCEARRELRVVLPRAVKADRSAMFLAFQKFYRGAIDASHGGFDEALDPFRALAFGLLQGAGWRIGSAAPILRRNAPISAAISPWINCGFGIGESEGILYLDSDPEIFQEFSPLLPSDIRALIRFQRVEHEAFADDGALRISWDQLAQKLERFELFEGTYPGLASEASRQIQWFASALFFGLPNSDIENDVGVLLPTVLAAWHRFADSKSPSRYKTTMRQILAIVDANGHRINAEVEGLRRWIDEENR
jgi:hypothetical protein